MLSAFPWSLYVKQETDGCRITELGELAVLVPGLDWGAICKGNGPAFTDSVSSDSADEADSIRGLVCLPLSKGGYEETASGGTTTPRVGGSRRVINRHCHRAEGGARSVGQHC